MKRIVPIVLIGIFAIYYYEGQTGRNLGVTASLSALGGAVDSVAGTNFAGGFAGGYGVATGVGASVGGGATGLAGGVSNSMGAAFGN